MLPTCTLNSWLKSSTTPMHHGLRDLNSPSSLFPTLLCRCSRFIRLGLVKKTERSSQALCFLARRLYLNPIHTNNPFQMSQVVKKASNRMILPFHAHLNGDLGVTLLTLFRLGLDETNLEPGPYSYIGNLPYHARNFTAFGQFP